MSMWSCAGSPRTARTPNIAGDYIAHGVRHRASEVLTHDLGRQTEWEVRKQLETEVEAERLTRLDRTLIERAGDGLIDLRVMDADADFGAAHQQLLISRTRQLERMRPAQAEGPLQWSMALDAEEVLRSMGERGDIIKTLHRAMMRAKLERPPQLYAMHSPGQALGPEGAIVGRVIARGLTDEMAERRYLVIDGIDGRSHYLDIGETNSSLPLGGVVRVTDHSTEPRQVDRTVAEIAAAHDGRYNETIHRFQDPEASEAFVQTHIRRLEAIRRATGAVERDHDGTWTIAPDHLDRVQAYEQRRTKAQPVTIEILSSQVGAEGPTWLDRQLVHDIHHDRADYAFGRDVHRALVRRQRWLIEQGLMQRDGGDVVYRSNLLDTLRRKELLRVADQLSGELGLAYADPAPGERVQGVYRRPVDLVGGRYALIENSREFTLAPWRPVLEQHTGRNISGIVRGAGAIDWTFGRDRGLSR